MRLIDADKFKENVLSGLYIYLQVNKEDIAEAIDDEPTIQNGQDYRYDIHTAIAQGKPYDTSGDLINREALKEAFKDTVCIEPMPYAFVKQIIDNAPTVNKCDNCDLMLLEKTKVKDYDQYMKGHKDGYKQAIIDGKLDRGNKND